MACCNEICGECNDCIEAFDKWEAEAPEREQRYRERLDSEGYYDDPEGWRKRQQEKRDAGKHRP